MAGDRLTVATFNMWFSPFFQERRLRALLDILREADADIIGLQEVVPETLKVIQREPWLADGYQMSEVSVTPYGAILLSRVPLSGFSVHPLPTEMGRSMVLAALDPAYVGGETMAVATVHLESLGYAGVRKQQLERIFPVLDGYDNAVLMGDFNMCASWDENANLREDYTDAWPALRPDEPGWTEDTVMNPMRLRVSSKRTQVRFDRVILRSERATWKPTAVERLGTEPIADELPEVFPSDHFGLRAVIARDDEPS